MTEPTQVQGPIQERKQATTNGDLWLLSGRQSDALNLANDDKRRVRRFVEAALLAVEKSRLPTCSWYELSCKRERRNLQEQLEKAQEEAGSAHLPQN